MPARAAGRDGEAELLFGGLGPAPGVLPLIRPLRLRGGNGGRLLLLLWWLRLAAGKEERS